MDQEYALHELQYALEFTDIYLSEDDIYLREAKCLKKQIPHVLVPLGEEDLVAGRMQHGFLGFSPQYGGVYTYYFHERWCQNAIEAIRDTASPDFIEKAEKMLAFWHQENTAQRLEDRFQERFPDSPMKQGYQDPGVSNAGGRLAGTNVDLDKLIRLGLPGLRNEIYAAQAKNGDLPFYRALLTAVDTIEDACAIYEKQAEEQAKTAQGQRKKDLAELVRMLHNIQIAKPADFKEGLQLFWIYSVVSDLMNYGRLDVTLGDLYANDLDSGALDEEEAQRYLNSWYQHLIWINKVHDCRVIIGGKGRRNEKNADRLAIALMETSRRTKEVVPQLTLRYYSGISEEVYDKALKVNAEGTTFPIIYSDDTNIPAVMKAYDIPEEEASRYVPFGCGEYVLEGLSVGTPNCGVNLLKGLELVLQNGYDHHFKKQVGLYQFQLEELDTFEKLWDAYTKEMYPWLKWVTYKNKYNYDVSAEQGGYLHISLLMDDCIARGKGVLNGGVRYHNAAAEIFGIISCADSFTAIKKLVYEDKRFTLSELAQMLRADFAGYEKEHQMLLAAPKYGNDDDYADEIAQKVFNHVALTIKQLGKEAGFDNYLIVSVNNSMSAEWGEYCLASACGRHTGAPMSNGNGASIGADKNGVTALLNSMAKIDPSVHVGVIHNVRFTKEMMRSSYDKVKELLRIFYENNGVQTNIAVVGKEDLQNAMIHPEKYQNLIIRIGGFSARFVELSPVVQNEILLRTTYES